MLQGCSDDHQAEATVEPEQTQTVTQSAPATPAVTNSAQTTTRGSDITFDVEESDFGTIWDPAGRPWRPENKIKYEVWALFHVAPQKSSRHPNPPLGDPKTIPKKRKLHLLFHS